MQQEKTIEELLKLACPSIRYRIRREIFNEPISTNEMQVLQAQILQDNAVKGVFNSQNQDGWLYTRFHGYDSLESGIRLLCEKGVDRRHPSLAGALLALEMNTDRVAREMGRVGKVLDEWGFGGALMIQATIFAYAGVEDKALAQGQIGAALEGFRTILAVKSIDEIVEPYKGNLVFKPGVKWPSIYHVRLLAFTHSWRIPQNQKIVVEAIKRLVRLSPLPYINVRYKSQLIAPASFGMQDFNPLMTSMNAAQWMMWFHQMELMARLGVVGSIPETQGQVNALREILDGDEGWFAGQINHDYFKRWGAYTGLMLERDWRIAQRRIFDLTFRSLLIQHYSKFGGSPVEDLT